MDLVYIKWIDSFGCNAGWTTIEDIMDEVEMKIESVGWVAQETSKYILLVPHVHGAVQLGKDRLAKESGCGDMAIPKSAIVERRILTIPLIQRKKK